MESVFKSKKKCLGFVNRSMYYFHNKKTDFSFCLSVRNFTFEIKIQHEQYILKLLDYVLGQFYGFTNDITDDLLKVAVRQRPAYMSLDDVFVTGVLREKIGARIWNWTSVFRYWPFHYYFSSCKVEIKRHDKFTSSYYDNHTYNELGFAINRTTPRQLTKHTGDGFPTLGECYVRQDKYIVIGLSEDSLGMTEIWKNVIRREQKKAFCSAADVSYMAKGVCCLRSL